MFKEIELIFPDGNRKKFKEGATAKEVAESLGPRLAKDALGAKLEGKLIDLNSEIRNGGKIEIITPKSPEANELLWHSTSHVMASAVKKIYPNAKFAIGPAIAEGFYYDFELEKSLSPPEDLEKIEAEMRKIISADEKFERTEVSKKEALSLFKGQPYKLELAGELADGKISIYKNGNFTDLCAGPHIPSTGKIKAVKLLKVSGAYWRGNEKNKMLQRIYGISFAEEKNLKDYLFQKEEAVKRNHLKLGKELDLFSMHDEAPGCVFFHPKGMAVWNALMEFWRTEHQKREYKEISTPLLLRKNLWIQSGHWDHYQENMYFTKIDEEDFAVKPMNCPGAILVYKNERHSYRNLPLKLAEVGTVHRHEKSGVLNGLFRVRKFTQDDSHIFCTFEQIENEVKEVINLIDYFYKTFNFSYRVELSTRPAKAMGSEEMWETATNALKNALKQNKIEFKINEGDGAFYGPKIDFHIMDSLNRTWQCATIQLDFSMPEKFGLSYIGTDDKEHRPAMIHRVVFGSIERFIGVLIEHYGGNFPLWLSPVQVKILSVADRHNEFAEKLKKMFLEKNIRVELDLRNETISYKVRDCQLQKIPYILVVGDKEITDESVTIRKRGGTMQLQKNAGIFLEEMLKEIEEKK